jgi:hypothetical protein
MRASDQIERRRPAGPAWVAAGVVLVALAWLLPVHPRALAPAVLRSAGEGTATVAGFGRQLVETEKIGPAAMVLMTARSVGDPGAAALARDLAQLESREPAYVAWGGWDPYLVTVFPDAGPAESTAGRPALDFFLPVRAREALRAYLIGSGSIGVQALLRTRSVGWSGRLVAADQPGGQPLDALILLTAFLYQGDRLSAPLQREVHGLADRALARGDLGELGEFYLNLLSLGRRLDWTQLCELLRRTDSARTVAEYAQLARVAPDSFALIYTGALFTESADHVAAYLLQFGKAGALDLRLAMGDGRGAVRTLIDQQLPVDHSARPALTAASAAILAHPVLMLALKFLAYVAGAFLVLWGLDRWIVTPGGGIETARAAPQWRTGALALFLSGLFIVATEPYLLKAAASAEYRPTLHLPMLLIGGTPPPAPPSTLSTPAAMHSSTIISIGFFALLQVIMYFICLQKINQIDREAAPPLLKLRLMENEENLFDSGLYVGMMGTAAALVMQVLGIIEPNLLAAYSSNLFGIFCVALVKIRHVRTFKKRLILANESGLRAAPAGGPR